MGEAGLAGSTGTFDSDVTDGGPSGDADMYYKARIFPFVDILPVELSIVYFKAMYQNSKFKKNQNKTITITICKTEFRGNIYLKITRFDVPLLKYGE